MGIQIRDLRGLDEYRAVVALEQEIWGYTDLADVVTAPVFIITVKRGAILLGAFEESGRLVGFAYSLVGLKDGRPTQWSHMLGVIEQYRGAGLGRLLKLAQRERALAAGFDLMEWTFDPLQALNAHFNFATLGVVCNEYVRNLYGDSTSTLHRGTPTDRFVVQWHMREPHVERRIARDAQALQVRSNEAANAPTVNAALEEGRWLRPGTFDVAIDAPRVWVEIPAAFTALQQEAPDLALSWRESTRQIFETYFARGYRAVDFELGRRRYLLAQP